MSIEDEAFDAYLNQLYPSDKFIRSPKNVQNDVASTEPVILSTLWFKTRLLCKYRSGGLAGLNSTATVSWSDDSAATLADCAQYGCGMVAHARGTVAVLGTATK